MNKLYFNGINGRTGEYFSPPLDLETLQPIQADCAMTQDAQARLQMLRRAGIPRGDWMLNGLGEAPPGPILRDGSPPRAPRKRGIMATLDEDPADLSRVGWGVIFPKGLRRQVRQALEPLLELRRSQTGGGPGRYREFEYDPACYKPGTDFHQFLQENEVGPGQVDIRKMPYYLLIVGSPQQIPFGFQFQLDAQYAVGRLYFRQWTQYRRYAENVVRSESKGTAKPRRLALFGVRTPGDWATEQTCEHLIGHLSRILQGNLQGRLETLLAGQATKERLGRLMGGSETPSVLLTASHGVCFHKGDGLQQKYQGALLCQDWPGHGHIPSQEHWMSAEDIPDSADLSGLIAFQFACFTGGTPDVASFFDPKAAEAALLSKHPFVARMPQRMLSHPQGALAVIGHVDQAYVHSFLLGGTGSQTQSFESTLKELMARKPVGLAMESFGQRYSNLAAWLHEQRDYSGRNGNLQRNELFMACHDARSYMVLGDPAVRLPVQRPASTPATLPPQVSTSAAPRLHALLIGSSFYFSRTIPTAPNYPTLGGCVQDVEAMRDFLRNRLGVPPERIRMLTATDVNGPEPFEAREDWPTYDNMVQAFQDLSRQAQAGDQLLIHYAGHGGRTPTCIPEEKGECAMDESLVPIDIGSNPESRYLRDVEMAKLLQDMTAKGLFVTLVLDSCHSGGATRGDADVAVRGVAADDPTDRLPSRIGSTQELAQAWRKLAPPDGSRSLKTASGWLPGAGGYLLLAACQATEKAYECAFENGRHGALTYWLLDSLDEIGPDLTYRALHNRILSKVHSRFPAQTPQLEGDGARVVLGCERRLQPPSVTVLEVDSKGERVCLNTGLAQGIRKGALFAVYPRLATDFSSQAQAAVVKVDERGAVESWAKVLRPFADRPIQSGDQAVLSRVSSSLRKKVRWFWDSEDRAKGEELSAAFETALQKRDSSFLKLMDFTGEQTSHDHSPDFQVHVGPEEEIEIWDAAGNRIELHPALHIDDAQPFGRTAERLDRLARFRNALDLDNPSGASLLGGVLTLEVNRLPDDYEDGDPLLRLPMPRVGNRVEVQAEEWVCITVKNASAHPLNATVLSLQSNWAIDQVHPESAQHVLLQPGQEEHFALQASLPEGCAEGTDVIKAFGTVGSTNFRWLEQSALDEPSRGLPVRTVTRSSGSRLTGGDQLEEMLACMAQGEAPTRNAPQRTMRGVGYSDALEQMEAAAEADSGLTLRVMKAGTAAHWTAAQIEVHVRA